MQQNGTPAQSLIPAEWQANRTPVDADPLYANLRSLGLQLGPAFRLIQRYWSGNREVLAELVDIEKSGRTGETTFVSTPLLDACCQVIGAIGLANDVESLYLPTRYARFMLFAPLPTRLYCHVLDRSDSNPGSNIREFDLTFLTHDGQVLGYLTGFQVRRAPRTALLRALQGGKQQAEPAFGWQLKWKIVDSFAEKRPDIQGTWLVVGGGPGAASLAKRLRDHGCTVLTTFERFCLAKPNPPPSLS